MLKHTVCLLFFLYGMSGIMTSASAQSTEASTAATPLDQRIEQIIPFLIGAVEAEAFFDPIFLSKIASAAQMKAFAEGVVAQFGAPLKITQIQKIGETVAILKLQFGKANAIVDVSIDSAPPNKIIGFRIAPEQPVIANDSLAKIDAELAALPGRVGSAMWYKALVRTANALRLLVARRKSNSRLARSSSCIS